MPPLQSSSCRDASCLDTNVHDARGVTDQVRILVVCWANICRSPYAAAALAQSLPQCQVASAGVGAISGMPADDTMAELAGRRLRADLSLHRSVPCTEELMRISDLILVMERQHKVLLQQRFPHFKGKITLLGHFLDQEVPDPHLQHTAQYEQCVDLIDACVSGWVQAIRPNHTT